MKFKAFAFLALAALSTAFASASEDLIVNRVFINPQGGSDDGRGLELFEIKNVGTTTVDLGSEHIALVGIENESGQKGELDFWYEFSGSLAPGATLCIRDKDSGGSVPTVTGLYETSNGTSTNYEFFSTPGESGTDLSNSGCSYILVKGFHNGQTNPTTGHAYKFLDQLDANNDSVIDFKASGATTDDLWDSEMDAIVVAPDSGSYGSGFDDYTANLTMPHEVVGVQNSSWTADYVFRLQDTVTGEYDEAYQMDVNALDANHHITSDNSQRGLMSGNSYTITGTGSVPGTVNFYVVVHAGGNYTDWNMFSGLTIGGHLYVH